MSGTGGPKRKTKYRDSYHVRFKPVLDEYEDRYLSSNDEGSDHIRPSSIGVRRNNSHDEEEDADDRVLEAQKRPLSVKTAIPFASPNVEEDANSEHKEQQHLAEHSEEKSESITPGTGMNPKSKDIRRTSTLQVQTSFPPKAVLTEEDLQKRTRLQTIFQPFNADGTSKEKSKNGDTDGDSNDREESKLTDSEEQEEKHHMFDLFEIAENIKGGQMMKLKTGVAGNLPVQDSFPMFKSSKQYLVLYWSVMIPQDDWSLAFFDETIDENYFAMNYFQYQQQQQQQSQVENQESAVVVDRPSLLKLAKKIIPISEVSEVFLDQKTTTSFRIYRGQEVTNCTPIFASSSPSSSEFSAALWADAIYSVLQLQSFSDDYLLQQYYHEYFQLTHPAYHVANPDTTTNEEEKAGGSGKNSNRNSNDLNNEDAYGDDLRERLSFNTELFRATKGLRKRGQSEDSTGNRSISPSQQRPSDEENKMNKTSRFYSFGFGKKKKKERGRKASFFAAFISSGSSDNINHPPAANTSPGSPTSLLTSPNKRGSIFQTMKNMFSPEKKIPFQDDAPHKLFQSIEDEQKEADMTATGQKSSPTNKASSTNAQTNNSSSSSNAKTGVPSPTRAVRRWTTFTGNTVEGGPKRTKGMETSVPLATLAMEQEALRNSARLLANSFGPTKKKTATGSASDPTDAPSAEGIEGGVGATDPIERLQAEIEGRSPTNYRKRAPSYDGLKKKPSLDTLTQSIVNVKALEPVKEAQQQQQHRRMSAANSGFRPPQLTKSYSESAAAPLRRSPPTSSNDNRSSSPIPRLPHSHSIPERHAMNFFSPPQNPNPSPSVIHRNEEGEEKMETTGANHEEMENHYEQNQNNAYDSTDQTKTTEEDQTATSSFEDMKAQPQRPRTPAEQLGRTTVLDYLYAQKQKAENARSLLPATFHLLEEDQFAKQNKLTSSSSGLSKEREGAEEEDDEQQQQFYEKAVQKYQQQQYQQMKSFQQLHQDLQGIKVFKLQDKNMVSPGKVLLEKDVFPFSPSKNAQLKQQHFQTRKPVTTPSTAGMSVDERLALRKAAGGNSPVQKGTAPSSSSSPFQSPKPAVVSRSSEVSVPKLPKIIPWNFVRGSSNNSITTTEEKGKSQEKEDKDDEKVKVSTERKGASSTNNTLLVAPMNTGNTGLDGRILDFLQGRSNSLHTSTGNPATESASKDPQERSPAVSAPEKQKSSSIISIPDNFFSFGKKDSLEHQQPLSSIPNQAQTPNRSEGKKSSSTATQKSLMNTTHNTLPKKQAQGATSKASPSSSGPSRGVTSPVLSSPTSFQNYYSKGMISDSEESLQAHHSNKRKDNTDSKRFLNDHARLIEREKERKAGRQKESDSSYMEALFTSETSKGEGNEEEKKVIEGEELENDKKKGSVLLRNPDDLLPSEELSMPISTEEENKHIRNQEKKFSPPSKAKRRSQPFPQQQTSVAEDTPVVSKEIGDRDISPLKEITSLKRIFGSMISPPIDLTTGSVRSSVTEERRKSRSGKTASTTTIPFRTITSTTKSSVSAPAVIPPPSSSSSTPVPQRSFPFPVLSPPSPGTLIPSQLVVNYYSENSSGSGFIKSEIAISLISKFDLQTKLLTSNQLVSRRAGLSLKPQSVSHINSSSNSKKKEEDGEAISLVASNIIIAELLESSYYLQFHAKRQLLWTTIKSDQVGGGHRDRRRSPSPDRKILEEFVFIPIEDLQAIDFDSQLSGLFRFVIDKSSSSFPMIVSFSSSFPITIAKVKEVGIFKEFHNDLDRIHGSDGGVIDAHECLLKARNIVELQVWLQFVISVYYQSVQSVASVTASHQENKTESEIQATQQPFPSNTVHYTPPSERSNPSNNSNSRHSKGSLRHSQVSDGSNPGLRTKAVKRTTIAVSHLSSPSMEEFKRKNSAIL